MANNTTFRAYGALVIVSIVWGTTYLALRIGVESFPPFLFSGIRQALAGGILLIGLLLAGHLKKVTKRDIGRQSITGILMIALGNGVIGWSERYIPSGLAALIVSILPVYIVGINYISGADKRIPNAGVIGGLILGCLGIALIFRDNLKDLVNPQYFAGMVVAFLACLAWASGSVYTKHKPSQASVLANASIQMVSGGIVLLLMSIFLDDFKELKTVTADSIWALIYLIVFGSLLAYTCFVYALEHLPVGVASLYAYINPLIAILLGYFFLEEKLTIITFLALMVTLGGVYCINRGYQKQKVTKQPGA